MTITGRIKEIINRLINTNTGGYFYNNNCRINYSSITGFYCKDLIAWYGIKTYNITRKQAEQKIKSSLRGAI